MAQCRVKIPEHLEKRIRNIISAHPELGYISIKGFVAHSIYKRVDQIKMARKAKNFAAMTLTAPSNKSFTYLPYRHNVEEWR